MPDPIPTQEQYDQAAREHAAHVKAREFDFDVRVNAPRRVILSVFPPLIAILLTYSTEIRGHGIVMFEGNRLGPMEWHDSLIYWPFSAFVTAVYLWILWAPKSEESE